MADSSNFSIPTVGALSLPPSLDPSLRPNLHCFAIPSEDQFTKLGPEIEQFDATIDGKQHRLFCTEEPGLGNSFWFGVETAKGTKVGKSRTVHIFIHLSTIDCPSTVT